jgi:hypothetical protein
MRVSSLRYESLTAAQLQAFWQKCDVALLVMGHALSGRFPRTLGPVIIQVIRDCDSALDKSLLSKAPLITVFTGLKFTDRSDDTSENGHCRQNKRIASHSLKIQNLPKARENLTSTTFNGELSLLFVGSRHRC